MKPATHPVARICLTLLGIVLIILALLSSGVRLGLPLVSHYKSTIESRVSDQLRSPVAIGELSFSWQGFGPRLEATQVSVFESADRKVTLDELLIDVNLFKSLMRGAPVINELTLAGASLAIEADRQGQFTLHGMESVRTDRAKLAAGSRGDGQGVDVMAWLLTARKVGLLDTQVTFIDQRAGQQLVMEDLNIRAENIGNVHQLRVDVRLPEELGGSLEAGIDLVSEADSLRSSDGDLYMKTDTVQVQPLLDVFRLAGLRLPADSVATSFDTSVSLELWGKWKAGQLVSARGPLTTSGIVSTVDGSLVMAGLSASLAYSQSGGQASMTATDIVVQAASTPIEVSRIDAQWPVARLSESEDSVWSVKATGEKLDVGAVGEIATALLFPRSPRKSALVQQASLRGELLDWSVDLHPGTTQPLLSLDAHISELRGDPVAAAPGFGPVNGRISMIDSTGELSLSAEAMPLPWPAMTPEPLAIDSLIAVIGLNVEDWHSLRVDADIEASDDGIDISTRLKAIIVPGQSPHLDVQSGYSAEDVTAFKQWLPRHKLSRALQGWIDRAIEGGRAENGSLLFFGHLAEFPFEEGEGVFRSNVDIADGRLSYLPGWPSATDIDGAIELNGLSLTGRASASRLDDFQVSQARVSIDSLAAPVLRMQGTGRGQLDDVVEFGKTGPLKGFLEPVLRDVTSSEGVEMDMDLTVPLYRQNLTDQSLANDVAPAAFNVDGSLFLSGNSLQLARSNLALSDVVGAIGFDQNGVRIDNLKAIVLGQPVTVSARTEGLASATETRVTVTGAMEGGDVLAHYGSPLGQFVRGASKWQVELIAPHSAGRMISEGLGLHVSSDLIGTEVLLPEPLYKTSGKAQSFELVTAFREDGPVQWDVRLDGQAHAVARVASAGLESLLIEVGDALLPVSAMAALAPGIRVQGQADRLAADDWIETIARLIESFPENGGSPEPILPISAAIDVESFELGAQSLGTARLRANSDDTYLNALLDNVFIEGSVRYPREFWRKDIPLRARMEHVDMAVIEALSAGDRTQEEASATAPLDPRFLPPIDARVVSFTYGDANVSDIVLRAQPDLSGLTITTLGFAYQTMQLVGQGSWRLLDPQNVNADLAERHLTQLNLVLQSDDFGEGLSSIGLSEVMSDGEGTVEMQLSWPGPAYLPAMDMLDGKIEINLARGSIIPLEPGAGKVMGLFALQALPRRLNLDFKDISADGLAFKRMTGAAEITDGVVDVELVQLTGPIGVVDVVGQTNLNTREFDQRITVLPRVSAALPIIGVISGGASAGVGALVAAGFLKAMGIDFDRIGLRDFSLTGSWDTPEFNSVATDYRRSR